MQLFTIETGKFRLDGGAMFGVVPKVLWQKTNPPDSDNQIDMAMRCLLIQEGNRLILIDNGIGHKYDDKFAKLYKIDHEYATLDGSLKKHGFSRADITDLVLTHLHFDHAGGTTLRNSQTGRVEVAFPKAKIYLQRSHLAWATNPNAREKASFFAENIDPLIESGQLVLVDGVTDLMAGVRLEVVNGHTDGQQLPLITYKNHKILYVADLFPTYGHLPLPYVMGYDTRPLLTLDERAIYLPRIVDEGIILFYEHDPMNECGTVKRNDKGAYVSDQTFKLTDLG